MSSEKFEASIKKLEAIVEELESGKLALDATLKHYEEGVKLAAFCTAILNKA
jgi:exodeoxyribonuclease VII small subunit